MLVGSVALAALAYGVAGALGGSGFLAVYLVGLALGDAPRADNIVFFAVLVSAALQGPMVSALSARTQRFHPRLERGASA